jgi:hypothetical protein
MRSPALVTGSIVAAALSIAACGNAAERSSERFCGELAAHATEIQTKPETEKEIASFITLFSKMGEVAPLDVQTDWEAIYGILKTANTVDPNDPVSVQSVADTAFAAQRSAEKVVAWAKSNCNIDLGPVGTVSGGAPVATTTIPPDTAPAG